MINEHEKLTANQGSPNVNHGSVASVVSDHDEEVKLNLKPLGWLPILLMTVIFIGLLAGLFLLGFVPAQERKAAISHDSKMTLESRPIVSVLRPYHANAIPALQLPASTRAFQETQIFPRANGYLKTRNVDIGDTVTQGQLLAEIDIPDVQAQLSEARAKLLATQASLEQARAQYELAQVTYNRSKDLSSSTISKQEIDEKQTAFLAARGALANAEGSVKAGEAEIQRLETLAGFSKVTAPFSGVVSARNYDVGALLSSATTGNNTEMFRIAQTNVLRVVVDVPQSYFDQIVIGREATFTVRNYPNEFFSGTIARTSGAVDPGTRTIRVEADFQNKDGRLLPGMYGQISLKLGDKKMPLLVPTSALVFGESGSRVATVGEDGKLTFAKIELGRDYGTEVEVLAGLTGSEKVITNPGERLFEGLLVQAMEQKRPDAQKVLPLNPLIKPDATTKIAGAK